MKQPSFFPKIDLEAAQLCFNKKQYEECLHVLAEPFLAELYLKNTFDFVDQLTEIQQVLIFHNYMVSQMNGGGCIQLLHNGYIGILIDLPEFYQKINLSKMAVIIDNIIKFYIINKASIDAELSVEEFAQLYSQFPEAESLDQQFMEELNETERVLSAYAIDHFPELGHS